MKDRLLKYLIFDIYSANLPTKLIFFMPSSKKPSAKVIKKTVATKSPVPVAKKSTSQSSVKPSAKASVKPVVSMHVPVKTINTTSNTARMSMSLIVIIIFIASIFSASFVFAGIKLYPNFFLSAESSVISDDQVADAGTSTLDKAVDAGIQRFIKKQQEDQQAGEEAQQKEVEQKAQNVRELSKNEDHVRGNVNANVSIIEYSDFECPYCKRNHPTVKQVFEKYDGKVNWVYRHLPLPFHLPNAVDEAEASECVAELNGNNAFWKFNDLIYERTPSNKGLNFEQLRPLAEEIGVNGSAFDICMASDKHLAKIETQSKEADAMGVRGTPANLIRNNKTGEVKFLGGAYPAESFEAAIDAMLK